MPLPTEVAKLRRSLAREEVYEILHGWIIDGTLRPGEQLRDMELAKLLGVSRTPVREALRSLEDEGLVQTALTRWTRVAPIDLDAALHHFQILGALERLAIEVTPPPFGVPELEALESANTAMADALRRQATSDALTAAEEFHRVLTSCCGNPELTSITAAQNARLRRIFLCYMYEGVDAHESVHDHALIIATLRAHDHDRAAATVEAHWQSLGRRYLARIQERRDDARAGR